MSDRYDVSKETLARVAEDTVPVPGGHWSWKGPSLPEGYSVVYEGGAVLMVHRIHWRQRHGPLRPATGMHLANVCGEKWCVNPDHWQEATPGELARRSHSSLTWPVVRAMRALRDDGWTAKSIASHFGRKVSQVKMILANHRWPEEEDPERAER